MRYKTKKYLNFLNKFNIENICLINRKTALLNTINISINETFK
jgi:hypothetical protein